MYLARAERLCEARRTPVSAPPDRQEDPQGFGAWLAQIAASNDQLARAWQRLAMPPGDQRQLRDLLALRRHANDLYLRSAEAFEAFEPVTGEQFLDAAMQAEAQFRKDAKMYGFQICAGSDSPGQ